MQIQESINLLIVDKAAGPEVSVPMLPGTRMVSARIARMAIMTGLRVTAFRCALKQSSGNPLVALKLLHELTRRRKQYFGNVDLKKFARVGRQFFWTLESPGWPGPALNTMLGTELGRLAEASGTTGPRIAFVSITKKCPLACEHCYDWHNHNGPEGMTAAEITETIDVLQKRGASQIFLSGGEPLARFGDLLTVVSAAKRGTDLWILTSGYKLTLERAMALKDAGLMGVSVSLDHYDPAHHNGFRGMADSFDWVVKSVRHAHQAGIAVALSICVTREFCTHEKLFAYARLAQRLGVAFVQVLEPRAVGRFADQDVDLSAEQLQLLERFYHEVNFDDRYRDWPIVSYHGFHQRTLGCSGAGQRFLYIDADGDVHACPFCHTSKGNVRCGDFDGTLRALKETGCMAYPAARA